MEKYLPVGSVCTLGSTNKKYVIAGYFSLEYNSSVKMYDYVGIPYPEGLLLHNKIISFNHEDILKVDFFGYNDEVYNLFNKRILGQSNEVDSLEQNNDILYNFTFDKNGVVVYDYETINEEKTNLNNFTFENKLENPFNKKYDFSNQNNDLQNTNTWSIFEKYKFDENGNVVLEEKKDPTETEYKLNQNKSDNSNENNEKYKFDENGILVLNEE